MSKVASYNNRAIASGLKASFSSGLLTPGSELLRSGAAGSLNYGSQGYYSPLGYSRSVGKYVEALSQARADLELFQRGANPTAQTLAREMSAAFFEENPGANIHGAVAFVPCKIGQEALCSLPFPTFQRLLLLEEFGRRHRDVAPIALVGLQTANLGLIRSGSNDHELFCRFAFKVAALIGKNPMLFARVSAVFDVDVQCSNDALDFCRMRNKLDIGDADRIATAIKALSLTTSGVEVKIGASNFGSRRDIENAKRFASRDQMHLFLGQTIAEDNRLEGEMAFLYASGPASRRLGHLTLNAADIENAQWLKFDLLNPSQAEFRQSWAEHEQIGELYRMVYDMHPALAIVDANLAMALDCSNRMLGYHDDQLFEISTSKAAVNPVVIEKLKHDYSRAMRSYLRDLSARNFSWLVALAEQIGFRAEVSVIGRLNSTSSVSLKAA